jgi:MFS family permease
MKSISRTVWLLSWVSLFTDLASEMLYPIMPVYLRGLGYSIVFIGLLEGIIEAIAGLSKAYFGHLSDFSGKRLPFVRIGYLLSAISKPLMAAFASPFWVVLVRSIDRLGKGVRSAPRDALLNAECNSQNKGKVFGFHRSMDTVGAMLGPVLALVFLYFNPGEYRLLFLLAFVPGLLAIAFTLFIKEKVNAPVSVKPGLLALFRYRKNAGLNYRKVSGLFLLFALFNSSDVFLLLKIKEAGQTDFTLIALYIFYNLIYALTAFPMGKLGDRIGMKPVFVLGLVLFAASYAGLAWFTSLYAQIFCFLIYGLYAACTEGIAKAWIGQTILPAQAGLGYGSYMALQSLFTMLASFITATLWQWSGPAVALAFSAAGALLLAILVLRLPYPAETE